MRIIIDWNGSKAICRVTHYLNENSPHYNDYTYIRDINDDVYELVLFAFKAFANTLKDEMKLKRPSWWRNRQEEGGDK